MCSIRGNNTLSMAKALAKLQLPFCCLPLGGGSVRNLRAEQITLNNILVEWDHASSIPRRGYRIRVPSQEAGDVEVDRAITSFTTTIATGGAGRYAIVVWPASSHFVPIPLTIWVTLKGEKWCLFGFECNVLVILTWECCHTP